jgi:DnaJ family protein A protein 2
MVRDTTLYDRLELTPNATELDIKKAYRRLALQYHPDKHPNGNKEAEDKFKEIAEAYSILSKPETRKTYDEQGQPGVAKNFGDVSPEQIFAAFINSLFSSGNSISPTSDDLDIVHEFSLSLADLYRGKTSRFGVTRRKPCPTCLARPGVAPASKHLELPLCPKTVINTVQQGPFQQISKGLCPNCEGRGVDVFFAPGVACTDCSGRGYFTEEDAVGIRIQPGSYDGQLIISKGKGNYSLLTRTSGDLVLVIREQGDRFFLRDPMTGPENLFLDIDISLCDALVGYACEIPHPGGNFLVQTGGIVEPNSMMVVRGAGMPKLGTSQLGDLFIKFHIKFPKTLPQQSLDALARVLPHRSDLSKLNWSGLKQRTCSPVDPQELQERALALAQPDQGSNCCIQ